MYFFARIFKSD